jgi:hypothetical protein
MSTRVARPHQTEALTAISKAVLGIINLPTGTGKSLIQAGAIAHEIELNINSVHVVLAPRILLTNQLFASIKEDLVNSAIDCQYLVVHSGKGTAGDLKWLRAMAKVAKEKGIAAHHRDVVITTRKAIIIETYDKAQREGIPLVIMGTYDSANRIIESGIPVTTLHCDEAHYLVPNLEDNTGKFASIPRVFPTQKKYYYTATMKFTSGNLGMNNPELFGEIIYQKLPIEMIHAGEILRPRMHLVNVPDIEETDIVSIDVAAITAAFEEHRAMIAYESSSYIAPKMLVVAQGSEHLNDIVNHPRMIKLMNDRGNLTIFDISSAYKPRINGVVVKRDEFLKQLQGLTDQDEAIIVHVRILSEGIDVPGITGIMPLNNLKQSTFLQTLGRGTRLHSKDRSKLYSGDMKSDELRRFVKPYAWVIVPVYGTLGEEIRKNVTTIIENVRSFGFQPFEDIFVKTSKGALIPDPIGTTNEVDDTTMRLREFVGSVTHDIESREKADELMIVLSKKEIINMQF